MKPYAFYFLHGAVGSPDDFIPILCQLRQLGHQATALDLLDFLPQPSELPAADQAPYAPHDPANPLIQTGLLLNQHFTHQAADNSSCPSLAKPILVGYSMGGRLALHAVTHSSNPWHATVLISAHPGLSSTAARRTRWQQDQHWAKLAASLPWPEFLSAWHQREVLSATPTPDRSSLAAQQAAVAHSLNVWSLAHQGDFRNKFRNLPIHSLWIAGQLDPKFTDLAIEVTRNAPKAELQKFANAHHRIPFSHPEQLATSLHRFSQSLTTNTPS